MTVCFCGNALTSRNRGFERAVQEKDMVISVVFFFKKTTTPLSVILIRMDRKSTEMNAVTELYSQLCQALF